jgi:cytochrome c biogenesis protein
MKKFWEMAASMRAGLVLLACISVMAASGTIVWQGVYYRSPLFQLLIALLFLNLIFCGSKQIGRVLTRRAKSAKKALLSLRETALGLIHSGLVLILIGAVVHIYTGQSATLSVAEGDTVDIGTYLRLAEPWQLTLTDFDITYYDDGSPSQYYSYVQVASGDERRTAEIFVNHPLKHGDVKIYQQSFGYLAEVQQRGVGGEIISEAIYKDGEAIALSGDSEMEIVYNRYVPALDEHTGRDTGSLRSDNPYFVFTRWEGDSPEVGLAKPGAEIEVTEGVTIVFAAVKNYSVMRVKTDPGLPPITVGALMFLLGAVLLLAGEAHTPKNKASAPLKENN